MHMKRLLLGLDFDGVFSQGVRTMDSFLKINQPYIDFLRALRKGFDNVDVVSASVRQSVSLDEINARLRTTNCLSFNTLPAIAKAINADFVPFLLQDLYTFKAVGNTFEQYKEAGSPDAWETSTLKAQLFHKDSPESLAMEQLIYCKDKINIIYALTHYFALKYSEDQITLIMIDDNEGYLRNILRVFKRDPDLLPKNITLSMIQWPSEMATEVRQVVYGSHELKEVCDKQLDEKYVPVNSFRLDIDTSLKGIGQADKNYQLSTCLLTEPGISGFNYDKPGVRSHITIARTFKPTLFKAAVNVLHSHQSAFEEIRTLSEYNSLIESGKLGLFKELYEVFKGFLPLKFNLIKHDWRQLKEIEKPDRRLVIALARAFKGWLWIRSRDLINQEKDIDNILDSIKGTTISEEEKQETMKKIAGLIRYIPENSSIPVQLLGDCSDMAITALKEKIHRYFTESRTIRDKLQKTLSGSLKHFSDKDMLLLCSNNNIGSSHIINAVLWEGIPFKQFQRIVLNDGSFKILSAYTRFINEAENLANIVENVDDKELQDSMKLLYYQKAYTGLERVLQLINLDRLISLKDALEVDSAKTKEQVWPKFMFFNGAPYQAKELKRLIDYVQVAIHKKQLVKELHAHSSLLDPS